MASFQLDAALPDNVELAGLCSHPFEQNKNLAVVDWAVTSARRSPHLVPMHSWDCEGRGGQSLKVHHFPGGLTLHTLTTAVWTASYTTVTDSNAKIFRERERQPLYFTTMGAIFEGRALEIVLLTPKIIHGFNKIDQIAATLLTAKARR